MTIDTELRKAFAAAEAAAYDSARTPLEMQLARALLQLQDELRLVEKTSRDKEQSHILGGL